MTEPCWYTIERGVDGEEIVGMRPACCSAEPEPFNAMEEPFCRYCGAPVAFDEENQDGPDTEEDDENPPEPDEYCPRCGHTLQLFDACDHCDWTNPPGA